MTVFSEKLDRLPLTVEAALRHDVRDIAEAFSGRESSPKVIAIGSGGSAISAEFLAACRRTHGRAITLVQTPLEFALGDGSLFDSDIWIFSARGENADIVAAFRSALSRGAKHIYIFTTSGTGRLASEARGKSRTTIHALPTAEAKDGFLATHSLVTTVVALLRAAALAGQRPIEDELGAEIRRSSTDRLSPTYRNLWRQRLRDLGAEDTLIVLADPRITPGAVLIETSVWETSLCPLQLTDFRNFAHGRHVWLHHRPNSSVILAMCGHGTRDIWRKFDDLFPSGVRRHSIDYQNCGRFQNWLSILDGLVIIEALGLARGIDPGKPGVGPNAGAIYDDASLETMVAERTSAVRQKRAAADSSDKLHLRDLTYVAEHGAFREKLTTAEFGALVLDYDGTVVATNNRYSPPNPELICELQRLIDGGIRLAFATGRGGSAGESLRPLFAASSHQKILMGYYNGGYLQYLDTDISLTPAPRASEIIEVAEWLSSREDLLPSDAFKDSGVQITIQLGRVSHPENLLSAFSARFGADDRVSFARSAHSLDIFLASTCKTTVVAAVAEMLSRGHSKILCVGDSGAAGGNDHRLLGTSYGISVGAVCDRPDVCWSLFGSETVGPEALLLILKALELSGPGTARLRLPAIG